MSETTNTPAGKPGGAPVWMRVLLTVSLAANLLILGMVMGAFLTKDRSGGPADRMQVARDLAPPAFVLALPQTERRALIEEFRKSSGSFRGERKAVRESLRAFLAALRSESFDAEQALGMLEGQRDRAIARQTKGAELFVRHLSDMSLEERRSYADRLEDVLRRGPGRP